LILDDIVKNYNNSSIREFEEASSIFYSKISLITISAAKKGAPNAKKLHTLENGLYNNVIINKIKSLDINCSIFNSKATKENISIMNKFFEENKCIFEEVESDYISRLMNMSFDIGADSLDQYDVVFQRINYYISVKNFQDKLESWKEFKIKIDLSKLPESDLKTDLINHLNQKVQKNGKEINSFSYDITDIINRSFQKYLEENKLTFDANNPSPSLDSATRSNSITMQK